jgi:hypothetical protein
MRRTSEERRATYYPCPLPGSSQPGQSLRAGYRRALLAARYQDQPHGPNTADHPRRD